MRQRARLERLTRWCAPAIAACAIGLMGCGSGAARSHTSSVASPPPPTPAAAGARPRPVQDGDWPTFDYVASRTGTGPAATGIDAANVHQLVARVVALGGTVDASAIQLHDVRIDGRLRDAIFLTTTYGRTVAIDPGTGGRLWTFTPGSLGRLQGSSQVTTATPVADPDRRFIYAASPDGYVHKLSVATGREVHAGGWPVRVTHDASREKIAAALNLSGSSVIVVTGGYIGDMPVYQGHLVLIDRTSGRITHVFNTLCSNIHTLIDPPSACPRSDSAIWARAGAIVEPGSARILLATGNGVDGQISFNGRTDWGDSVLELSPTAQLLHNWPPTDQQALNDNDLDLGSTAPALVYVGGRQLAVQGGKAGHLDLLDLDRLDGTTGPAGPQLGGQLQQVSSPGGGQVLTAPAVWPHGGRDYVFVADDSGTTAYVVSGGADPRMRVAWSSARAGTSPVMAGGLLFIYDELDGALDVLNPISGVRITSLLAPTGHWNSPIVIGGRIILPVGSYHSHSSSGELYIWHLPGR